MCKYDYYSHNMSTCKCIVGGTTDSNWNDRISARTDRNFLGQSADCEVHIRRAVLQIVLVACDIWNDRSCRTDRNFWDSRPWRSTFTCAASVIFGTTDFWLERPKCLGQSADWVVGIQLGFLSDFALTALTDFAQNTAANCKLCHIC